MEIKYALLLLNKNLFLQRSPFPFSIFSNSRFYTLNNHILQQVKQNPYLGILLSEDLKWEPHLINTTKKANSTLAFLKRNPRHCPEACRRTAYIALVRSVLEYRSTVWGPYYVKDIDRLEKVQHQAARFISGDYATREPGCISKMLKGTNHSRIVEW